ncbi:hypothetical protein [Actinomadura flavalba]|uniref:hypothetical protein n=1 Tax=Actinomadura flavalba TaxID=1120938 RepID=UPI00038219C5|nr:hypothetical protein [Actinomadura flavalba]
MSVEFSSEGSASSVRALEPTQDGRPVFEATHDGPGTFAGRDVTHVSTYVSEGQATGSFLGNGHVLITTTDGGATAVMTGHGAAVRGQGATVLEWSAFLVCRTRSAEFGEWDGRIFQGSFTMHDDGRVVQKLRLWP